MRLLIVATNETPQGIEDEIRSGKHNRVDYLDLARAYDTDYIDYGCVPTKPLLRRLEQALKLDFQQAAHVVQLVKRNRYDAVLSLSERVGIPLSLMLDRKIKHATIFHHPMSPTKLRVMQALRIGHRLNALIAISPAEAEGLTQNLRLPANRVHALLTPVDTDFYQPLDNVPSKPHKGEHILSLGLSYRDYPTLIRAMTKLPHIPCQIRAGSTWITHSAGYEKEEIPANIELMPFVHRSVLRECYAQARFIIVPIKQTTQWSAGCTSVQIAQAMGKAVITTRLPGLADYIRDGETGMLVDAGDPDALAAAIDRLWRERDLPEKMGQKGRELMTTTVSMKHWLEKLSVILGSLSMALAMDTCSLIPPL